MFFIFTTQMLIRHLWQHKTAVFLHRCVIHAVLLELFKVFCSITSNFKKDRFCLTYELIF
jgi:hypothetical protein